MPKVTPKTNELSSREDFVIQQFGDMKKINTMANKLFDSYYLGVDPRAELSPMMRAMVPSYYIDPNNPDHPGCYALYGKSSVSYLERLVHVLPFVNSKGKYEYDLSAWNGLLINPVEFAEKAKALRKSKLEPNVIMGDHNGSKFCQALIMREADTKPKDELAIPFLELPNRQRDGEDIYQLALQQLIYEPSYQYLHRYLAKSQPFAVVPTEIIEELMEMDICEFITEEGDRLAITKSILPIFKGDQIFKVCRVENPDIDTSEGRFHYIVAQTLMTEDDDRRPYMTIYTLMAALQLV